MLIPLPLAEIMEHKGNCIVKL